MSSGTKNEDSLAFAFMCLKHYFHKCYHWSFIVMIQNLLIVRICAFSITMHSVIYWLIGTSFCTCCKNDDHGCNFKLTSVNNELHNLMLVITTCKLISVSGIHWPEKWKQCIHLYFHQGTYRTWCPFSGHFYCRWNGWKWCIGFASSSCWFW
jgi:hypothetical protein